MSESVKKWLLWSSFILVLISTCGIVYGATGSSRSTDIIFYLSLSLLLISLLNLIFLFSIRYQNRTGFRKTVRILTYLLLVFIFFTFAIDAKWIPFNSELGYVICVVAMLVLMLFANVNFFILHSTESIGGIILILIYIITSLVLKRYNYGDPEPHLIISFLMIGSGMYIFGLRCILIIDRNKFLKVVSTLASLFIFLGCFEMMYFSANYAGTLLIIYSISFFLLTLIVLLSLPVSGYIQWTTMHKKILKKILIPWVFFLLIISVRFVFPSLNYLFFREKKEQYQEFFMDDYQIQDKNGLEPK